MRFTNMNSCSFLFLIILFHCLFQFNFCDTNVIYNITSSQALSHQQVLISPSHVFELGFFNPNNSANRYVGIWYRVSPQTVVWVANRESPLIVTDSLVSLTISSNGNLVLLNGDKNSVWSTNIAWLSGSSFAELTDDGNFLLLGFASREELWQSFDHPGDTLLPGTVLGFNTKTGERKVLTSWKNETDPSLGNFVFGISQQKPTQAIVWINGTIPYYRSGPWNRLRFIGVPEMETSYQSPVSIQRIQEDVEKGTTYFSFNWHNKSSITKVFMSSQGSLKILINGKGGDENGWFTAWEEPKGRCYVYGVCGTFGVCIASESPNCKCLKGFVPKSYEEWRKGIWTGGCVRRAELLCERNNRLMASRIREPDGFWKISNLKLPDSHKYMSIDYSVDCRIECLNNCSCTAYAYVIGIGCLVWSQGLIDIQEFSFGGEDLFLRLAHKELQGDGLGAKKMILIITVISGCVAMVATVFALHFRRANHRKGKQSTGNFVLTARNDTSTDAMPFELARTIDLQSILVATNHFSTENKLGQGGFGPVYKGKLHDGIDIAVKRLSTCSGQGIEEFKNEAVLISKLQHRNLVRLVGCCTENGEKILVYEFMPNKSLDVFIFDSTRRGELNWAKRFKIIHGIARGLLYLHHDSCLRVIHRDLKVSNILLDDNFNPKISDFGLSRILEGATDIANTHKVAGTIGYMSPEYAIGGIISEKSYVYSFGVLVLETVSGTKNTDIHYCDHQQLSLVSYAWQMWSKGKGLDLADGALVDSYCPLDVIRCIHVGLLCVQDHPDDRPTMPDVIYMLSNETYRPQPSQPIFEYQSSLRSKLPPHDRTKSSLNDVTMSLIEGR